MPGSPAADLIRVTESCTAGCADNGGIANLIYRSPNFASNWQGSFNWRASASYVLGAQSMKFGYQGGYLVDSQKNFSNSLGSSPTRSVTACRTVHPDDQPLPVEQRVRYDAFYAQEQWTLGRMTLQGALRFDHASSFSPREIGGVPFLPAVTCSRRPRASTPTTTSRRAAASPTICSATARRRSR